MYFGKSNSILLMTVIMALMLILAACSSHENAPTTGASATESAEMPAQEEGASSTASTDASDSSSPESATRRIVDELGHELTIPAKPLRVLAPYLEDALTALGTVPVAQYAAGTYVQPHLQEWLKDVPPIDLNAGLSPEVVMNFQPDVIVISRHFLPDDKYESMAKVAPVFVLNDAYADWRQTLKTVADVLGKSGEAEAKLAEYEVQKEGFKTRIRQAIGEGKTTAIVWPDEKQPLLIGNGFLSGNTVYGELGLTPHELAAAPSKDWTTLSLEMLPELDADYLFVVRPDENGMTEEQTWELLDRIPLWKDLPAVKAGHVYQGASGHWVNSGYIANLRLMEDVSNAVAP